MSELVGFAERIEKLEAEAEALREALREIADKTAHGEVHRIARAALSEEGDPALRRFKDEAASSAGREPAERKTLLSE